VDDVGCTIESTTKQVKGLVPAGLLFIRSKLKVVNCIR